MGDMSETKGMRVSWMLLALSSSVAPSIPAIDPEIFCVPDPDPLKDACTDNQMNIRFKPDGTSDIWIEPGKTTIEAVITIDTKSTVITGFTYGVKHDTTYFDLAPSDPATCDYDLDVIDGCNPTTDGTTKLIENWALGGWGLVFVAESGGIIACTPFTLRKRELPVAVTDYPLCNVKYQVIAHPPESGARISFTDDLNPPGSPPTTVNLTIDSRSRRPGMVQNGVVRGAPGNPLCPDRAGFHFGPYVTSEEYWTHGSEVAVTLSNTAWKGLGFSLGIEKIGDELAFVGDKGAPAVDLSITKEDGTVVSGESLKGNAARGAASRITGIERGQALSGNSLHDFLDGSIDPSGAWATVVYVADVTGTGKMIPASPGVGPDCGQEILVVKFSQPTFRRGDANGDSRIGLTDAILVIQNIFVWKLLEFDCKDMLDVNDDDQLNIADPVHLLSYLFMKGPEPAAPFDTCGPDSPDIDGLDCKTPNCP